MAPVPPDLAERHGGPASTIMYSGPTVTIPKTAATPVLGPSSPSSSCDEGSSHSKENASILSNNIPVITNSSPLSAYNSFHPSVVVSTKGSELLPMPSGQPLSLSYNQWTINETQALGKSSPYTALAVPPPTGGPTLPGITRKKKRQPQPIPEECKDEAYWERRKRNNESAKRSREVRRLKEHHTALRVVCLENDNLRLKTEVEMLRGELDKLRQMLCNQHMGRN